MLLLHYQVIRVHRIILLQTWEAKPLPHKSILFFKEEANIPPATTSLLRFVLWHQVIGHHLSAKIAKVCCFLTYNNMGSKTLSTKCTFASLTRQNKRLSRICWPLGVKVWLTNNQRLCLHKCLLIVDP